MSPHPLTSFEMQRYYQMSLGLMVFLLEIMPKLKDGAYVINLDEYSDISTHWVALYVIIDV